MNYQLIIAGDYRQFLNYLKGHRISKTHAVYISEVQALFGRAQKELENIIWTGTYWQRNDIDLIQNYLRAHNIQQESEKRFIQRESEKRLQNYWNEIHRQEIFEDTED